MKVRKRGQLALCGLGIEEYAEASARGVTGTEGSSTAWFLLRISEPILVDLMRRGKSPEPQAEGEIRTETETRDGDDIAHVWTRSYEIERRSDPLLRDLLDAVDPAKDAIFLGRGPKAFKRMQVIATAIHVVGGRLYASQVDGFPSFSFAIEGDPFKMVIAAFERADHNPPQWA